MTLHRNSELALALFLLLFLGAAYASNQAITTENGGFGPNGRVYYAMAQSFAADQTPKGEAPEIYRVGLPMAVATVSRALGWSLAESFDRLNVLFATIAALGLLLLLYRYVATPAARVVAFAAFLIEPHSPFRLSYFMPVSVNAAVLAILVAGLIAMRSRRAISDLRYAAALTAIVVAGVIVHEIVLLIGICVVFERAHRRLNWLPLAAGLATLWAVYAWIEPTSSNYTARGQMWRWLWEKSPGSYVLSWFLVFGPLLAMVVFFWRRTASFLTSNAGMLVYMVLFAGYAWVGGADTEALLAYASPIVWLLIGRGLVLSGLPLTSVAGLALLGAQAVAARAFVAIGGPLDTPVVHGQTWERLGSASIRTIFSYANAQAELATPFAATAYGVFFSVAVIAVMAWLARNPATTDLQRHETLRQSDHRANETPGL